METFFTSDLHLRHTNILKHCPIRGETYKTIENHDESIIKTWNMHIAPKDTVWFLGDFAFTKPKDVIRLLSELNGFINFIPGNHDKGFVSKLHGIPRVEVHPLMVHVKVNRQKLVLSHYPMWEWDGSRRGTKIHLHGHSHGNSPQKYGRIDVGWDNFYRPISLQEVISICENQSNS